MRHPSLFTGGDMSSQSSDQQVELLRPTGQRRDSLRPVHAGRGEQLATGNLQAIAAGEEHYHIWTVLKASEARQERCHSHSRNHLWLYQKGIVLCDTEFSGQ